MCRKLVTLEMWDNEKKATEILQVLRDETGLSWSMYAKAPDQFGHNLYEIYGLFSDDDVSTARNAVISAYDYGVNY
jgi:hypothetical protein